jgi:3-oxoacyl-[acyl-carrier-protein] synthase II
MAETARRVVVTGMGCITPLGINVDETWQGIVSGNSGIRSIRGDILANYPQLKVTVAAPIDGFDFRSDQALANVYSERDLGRLHRGAQFALWAGQEALLQAGALQSDKLKIDSTQADPNRVGIRMGTGIGGANLLGMSRERLTDGKRIAPSVVLQVLPERVATTLSMLVGARGSVHTAIGACATGNMNIIAAAQQLVLNQADMMIAGGAEAQITPEGLGLFDGTSALDNTEDAAWASRPFNKSGKGFVMGEGAGVLVLETLEHARRRGATIIAELTGYGETADAYHDTAPSGEGAVRALQLTCVGLSKSERGYVNAHATGTSGDGTELRAIAQVLDPSQAAISSTKSQIGHLLGAASAVESIISICALRDGIIPASLKMTDPIEETEGWDMSPDAPTKRTLDYVVNDSFGFGGLNAVTMYRNVIDT